MKLLLVALLCAGCPASAASNVTAKFDGVYDGAAVPVPALGASGCTAFPLHEIAIDKGRLKGPGGGEQPVVTGFITADGYVSAFLTRPDHRRSAMDGRLEDGVISAGFIEADSGCAFTITLRRTR